MGNSVYSNPVVGGVSQVVGWTPTMTVDEAMSCLGRNSGNMMFTEAIRRVLRNAKATTFAFDDSALAGRDSIVIAAANWINEFEDFGWLAGVLERTKLPVFLIGVGAQSTLTMSVPKLKPGTLRLLKIVAERSKSISARGEFTCDVLAHYGIKSARPTGCPSLALLLVGPTGPTSLRNASEEHVVLHATRHGFGKCDAFQQYLYQQAIKKNYDILLQSEEADIYYALGRMNNPTIAAKAAPAVKFAYGTDDEGTISTYLRQHGLFYLNFSSWISQISTKSFCMGTRIHGTVASLIARTPALLVAHDSRTLELARAMNIPHILSPEIPTDRDLDLELYMQRSSPMQLIAGYQSYRSRFMEFFAENGLQVSEAA